MKIIFEAHATTFDNEAKVASGWNDVALSPLGEQQARELRERYKDTQFDAIFCSDLQRSYRSARLAFPDLDSRRLFLDWRLRECNYGDFTQKPSALIESERIKRIHEPFPHGESYEQAMERMKSFVDDLRTKKFNTVLVIGSRATQYGLDVWLAGKSLEQCVQEKFVWQPGWHYELK